MENPSPEILNLEQTASLSYDTKGESRLLSILVKTVEEMRHDIHELKTQKTIDDFQLPPEILANSGLLPQKPRKLKRGCGYRPILQSEIEEAQKHSMSARGQAKWMGISLPTYKKYARMYGVYRPNPSYKGAHRMFDPEHGRFPLSKILNGDFHDDIRVSDWMAKDKLIRSGTFQPKCNICGYDKRRITDNKIALLLDHKDGNRRNYKVENLQLLCLNCTYECGRGYIRRANHMFDPDWIQGARIDEVDPQNRW